MVASRSRPHGFSLIELGIAIAVIAVLASVVLLGAGYIRAAKTRNAIEMVSTLRSAAKQFAMRKNNGLTYYNVRGNPPLSTAANTKNLKDHMLISQDLKTPWDGAVSIEPEDSAHPKCRGYACVRICLETPLDEPDCTTCKDIAQHFKGNSLQVQCGAGGCKLGGQCVLSLLSR